jgi:hypothetical protein
MASDGSQFIKSKPVIVIDNILVAYQIVKSGGELRFYVTKGIPLPYCNQSDTSLYTRSLSMMAW